MRKIVAALFLLTLAGCQTVGGPSIPNPATPKVVYELRLAYTSAVLIPAVAYRGLGLCPGASKSTVANPCAERVIVRKLQAADNKVQVAMLHLESFARDYPTLDASAYVGAVQRAITAATALLTEAR